MDLDYWSLQREPFGAAPDSRFFYSTPRHEQALAAISYAAREGGEPVLITGPVGCGKTLLLRTLRRQLPQESYHVAFVPELSAGEVGLLQRVAYHLAHTVAADTAAALNVIEQAIGEAAQQERAVVVMFDDWPVATSAPALDELHWLLNLDVDDGRVCALFTCQPDQSQNPWPAWLRQRLCTTVNVGPFEPQQIPSYLEHRLRAAGHADGQVFAASAAEAIGAWSECIPRLVNRLARLSLQVAALERAQRVEVAAVRQAIARLDPCESPAVAAAASGAET